MGIVGGKFWSVIWLVIFVPIGLYIGLLVVLTAFQSRLIYFPQRDIIATPDEIGLSYEDVYFEAPDGVKLSGWFIPAEDSRGVILYCHGNGGNISHHLEFIRIYHRLGLSTFVFDYRGFGRSEGKPTEQGTYLDAEGAWRYLVEDRNIPPTEIIIFGRSLGGPIAARLGRDYKPKALIIESAFTSVRDIAADLYPYLPVRFMSRFDYNTMDYLRGVRSPVLIVHSRDDEIVPFKHGRRLFEAAGEPKEFLEITGSHNEGFMTSGRFYEEGLNFFVSKHVGG
jgi:fermentation-respiration switch protein FrsA (DUF1100 family)